MATIYFGCPQCQKRYDVDASRAGTIFRCTNCYYRFPVPEKSTLRPEEITDFYKALPDGVQAKRAEVVAVCPLCYTTIPGYAEEMGTWKECPECGTKVEIREKDKKRVRFKDGITTMSTEGTDPRDIYALTTKTPAQKIDTYENAFRKAKSSSRIIIICPLCRTLISVTPAQIGTEIKCGECGRTMKVEENYHEAEKAKDEIRHRLNEMGIYDLHKNSENETVTRKETEPRAGKKTAEKTPRIFSFHCTLCGTLISASISDVGREISCPDCETKMQVPPPTKSERTPPGISISEKHLHADTYFLSGTALSASSVNKNGKNVSHAPAPPVSEPMIVLQCMLCGELQHIPQHMKPKLENREITCIECGRPMNHACIIHKNKTKLAPEKGEPLRIPEASPSENLFYKAFQAALRKDKRKELTTRESLDEYGVNAPAILGEEPICHDVAQWNPLKFFTWGILDILTQRWILLSSLILTLMFFLLGKLAMLILILGEEKTFMSKNFSVFYHTSPSITYDVSKFDYPLVLSAFCLLFILATIFGSTLCLRILLRTASGFDPIIISIKQLTHITYESLIFLVINFCTFLLLPGIIFLGILNALNIPQPVNIIITLSAANFLFPQALRSILLNGHSMEPPGNIIRIFFSRSILIGVSSFIIYYMIHIMISSDPFDKKVWKDLWLHPIYWGIFYFLSLLLILCFFFILSSGSFFSFPMIMINVFLTFIYFRLLGRVWFYSDEMRERKNRDLESE
ncbi:MAG: hypothetical protein Q4C96_05000 [Planctomycetia bacterium]|nr:hypothetical protein [Planctomycetia bacterium]